MSTTIHEEQPDSRLKESTPKTEKQARARVQDQDKEDGGGNTLSERARSANDAAAETVDGMRDNISVASQRAQAVAQEQPVFLAVGAMAVGVALGFALGNRR